MSRKATLPGLSGTVVDINTRRNATCVLLTRESQEGWQVAAVPIDPRPACMRVITFMLANGWSSFFRLPTFEADSPISFPWDMSNPSLSFASFLDGLSAHGKEHEGFVIGWRYALTQQRIEFVRLTARVA